LEEGQSALEGIQILSRPLGPAFGLPHPWMHQIQLGMASWWYNPQVSYISYFYGTYGTVIIIIFIYFISRQGYGEPDAS
jgi:hypothetical protein